MRIGRSLNQNLGVEHHSFYKSRAALSYDLLDYFLSLSLSRFILVGIARCKVKYNRLKQPDLEIDRGKLGEM